MKRRDLLGTYVVDMVGMFLAMPIVLFPALATTILKEPSMLGLLYTAEAPGPWLPPCPAVGPRGCITTAGR